MDQINTLEDPIVAPSTGFLANKNFVIVTLIGACAASLSAWLVASLGLPLWVMFTGFIAWYSRPTSRRESIGSVVALWLGMLLAPGAAAATAFVAPTLGLFTLPVSVFIVTALIVGFRALPAVGNILCWFLGFVTVTAASHARVPADVMMLIAASAVGAFAAWACQALSAPFEKHHTAN